MSALDLEGVRWIVETRDEEGGLSYRLGTRGETYVAEWGTCIVLEVTPRGERISLRTDGTVDPFFLAKVERGPVAALERRLRGALTLHASATAPEDGPALVLLGDSGAGKSTTAAALVARCGHALFADDMAWIDVAGGTATVVPTEASLYLGERSANALGLKTHDDHVFWDATTKCGVPARPAEERRRLGTIVLVEWGEACRAERLPALEAMRGVLPHVARAGITTRDARVAELENLSALLEAVFVYRVVRPKAFAALDEFLGLIAHLTPRHA